MFCFAFCNRLLTSEDVNLWKSGLMTLSTTSGFAVKVVMEVWMNWRLDTIFLIEYCAQQECLCCMIYTKQFCCTNFFLWGAIFLLLSYSLVWVYDTLSHINQNLQLHSKCIVLLMFIKLPWTSSFCNNILISPIASTVHVNHF